MVLCNDWRVQSVEAVWHAIHQSFDCKQSQIQFHSITKSCEVTVPSSRAWLSVMPIKHMLFCWNLTDVQWVVHHSHARNPRFGSNKPTHRSITPLKAQSWGLTELRGCQYHWFWINNPCSHPRSLIHESFHGASLQSSPPQARKWLFLLSRWQRHPNPFQRWKLIVTDLELVYAMWQWLVCWVGLGRMKEWSQQMLPSGHLIPTNANLIPKELIPVLTPALRKSRFGE